MTRTHLTALIVASALFMENLDSTVIATSLPAIAASIQSDPIALKLAFTAYLLSLAVFIPVSGWAADRFGARTVFCTAIGVFLVGSIGCAVSSSLTDFVLARIIQGMGGAMMTPVGRLVVVRSAPRHELMNAMTWLTFPALVGPLVGPPLGGFITTFFSWHWIFLINIPVGLLGLAGALIFVDNTRSEDPRPLDRLGFLLSGVGLSGLVFGLSAFGQDADAFPHWVAALLVLLGIASTAAYIRHARRTPFPLLDLGLARIDSFRIAVIGGFFFRVGMGAVPFLLPLVPQLGLRMGPVQAGSLTLVSAGRALLMKTTAPMIVRRFGFRMVLTVNAVLCAVTMAINGLFIYAPPQAVILSVLLVGGFLRSLQFTSLNTVAFADVEQERLSAATSFSAVAQQLAASTGVTLAALVLGTLRGPDGSILPMDFLYAFFAVGLFSAVSLWWFFQMTPETGEGMAGHEKHKAPVS